MKYFDIVNEEDLVIGFASSSEFQFNPNLTHRVAHFAVVDGIQQKILIGQRSPSADFDSGLWCFMAEPLLKGERFPTAVYRGMKDKINLESNEGIGEWCRTIFHQDQQTEFARFFVVYYQEGQVVPNPAEISQLKWVTADELRSQRLPYSKMTQYWIEHANWDEIMRYVKVFIESGIKSDQ